MVGNKSLIKQALSRVLRPLVALILRHGVFYREFTDIAKKVFFAVGCDILDENKTKQTASQISVLTGLHRKDVAVFLEGTEREEKDTSPLSAGAAIVAQWVTSKPFIDSQGHPKPLPYEEQADGRPSFNALVQGVSKDVRPKAYLEELLRLGLIKVDEKNIVSLQQEAFIPSEDFSGKLKFFTRNISDHLSASAANLANNHPRHFDRSAFHAELTEEDIAALRHYIDEQGMALLKAVYAQAEALAAAHHKAKNKPPLRRMTVGLYMYDEAMHDDVG